MKNKKQALAAAISLVLVFALAACAAGTGAAKQKDGKVTVSNIDELLDAIAPDTEITLKPGTYNLTQASDYGKDSSEGYFRWVSYGFSGEYGLVIEYVNGLHITGNDAGIITEPRAAAVLGFSSCDDLRLEGLAIGHTEAAEACEGGVVSLDHCRNVVIEDCSLYGCGTTGVYSSNSNHVEITDTDIHHCSSTGIEFFTGTGLKVRDCRISDCGTGYQNAYAAFVFSEAEDVQVSGCEVSDNYMAALVYSYFSGSVSFSDLTAEGNHFDHVFACDSGTQFHALDLKDNITMRWTDSGNESGIILDGAPLPEDGMNRLWGEQLTSAGIGTTDTEPVAIDCSGAEEVHVSSTDEFLAAIASDTVIVLDVPRIDLTDASGYGEGAGEDMWLPEFGDKNYAWTWCYDGFQLNIGDVSNFHIVGGEIITEPRYANVLGFYNCANVSFEKVSLGHSPDMGECAGGVLSFSGSRNIILETCDLYGCGVLGITTENVRKIYVQNTLIHDCSWGACQLYDTDTAVFLGCEIRRCPSPHFYLSHCLNFSWDGKMMDPESIFNVDNTPGYDEDIHDTIAEDTQEAAIMLNRDIWMPDDSFNTWYYCIADLNQDGLYEIIVASNQGTGLYTYADYYSMSDDMVTLNRCITDMTEGDSWPDIIIDHADCYWDSTNNCCYYIFEDIIRSGMAEHYGTINAVCFDGFTVTRICLAKMEEIYTDGETAGPKYYNPEGISISADDYYSAADRYFAGCEKHTAYFDWVEIDN